jgi:hypothetical protein
MYICTESQIRVSIRNADGSELVGPQLDPALEYKPSEIEGLSPRELKIHNKAAEDLKARLTKFQKNHLVYGAFKMQNWNRVSGMSTQ